MDRLIHFMNATAGAVRARLETLLPHADMRPEVLHEAMRYAVLGGGKRLRPILTLAAYDAAAAEAPGAAAGNDARLRAVDAACAAELLHCYRLVHDDLPCMDDDSLRRNRLTCHKAFGETTAVLVGDALQALAFRTLAEASGVQAARTVSELARAAGSTGMVGGQFLDYEGEGRVAAPDEIERIDRWKSGALFTACCRIGAVLGGADGTALEKLTRYGDAIGMAHQIADDISDYGGAQEGKRTYPAAFGLDAAREAVSRKAAEAKDGILDFGKEALHLRLFADYLLDRVKA